jgi:SAM-dependent methyltransferase
MHPEASHFLSFVKTIFPEYFFEKTILDVGSGDINGTNKNLFQNCGYNANDVIEAENVTIVSRTKNLPFVNNSFHTIISSECFEHDPDYIDSLSKIYDMLKPDGLFLFTCASEGRPEHGTRRTSPHDSYGTIGNINDMQDYYKNLTYVDVDNVLHFSQNFSFFNSYYNRQTCDLYFYGIKKGITKPTISQEYHAFNVVKNN